MCVDGWMADASPSTPAAPHHPTRSIHVHMHVALSTDQACTLLPPPPTPSAGLPAGRSDVVKHLADAFASVARPGKGGWVRDALSGNYPRLAHQMEAMFDRLTAETTIKVRIKGRTHARLWRLGVGAAAAPPRPGTSHDSCHMWHQHM